jgi:glycosyltransferase involved in cell wall biosynthesis
VDLSLIVPCYNEAPHLKASVDALCEVLDTTRYDYEVVFVDDVSPDNTRDVIREICAARPRCRAIFHEKNKGRGGAFKTGFVNSTGRVTGFIDIDLEVGANYIPALVNLIEHHGVDIATGHRHYLLRQTHAVHRVVLSVVYRALLRAGVVNGVRDSETGCKFFRRETATDVVLGSESDGWFWDTEVMARAVLAGLTIREMPVLFLRRWDKQTTVRLGRDIADYLIALHKFRGQIGRSLLNKSPIYWNSTAFDLVMKALYGDALDSTYGAVAAAIPDGASVVDVCAGTGRLYLDHLRARGCDYLGLDFNSDFVLAARGRGVNMRFHNVLTDPIPAGDYVTMVSSLYHFRAHVGELIERMKQSARRGVVISEPVQNLSAQPSLLGGALGMLTNPGVGEYRARFDLSALQELADQHGAVLQHASGDRNAILIFPGTRANER